MRYNNYHKHTMYSNLRTLDCVVKPIDYINRAKELGHTTYFTTEHGFQGNIYEAFTLCQQNGLKCIYGVEAYYVDDIEDKSSREMYHIMLIAMTENARREINKIMSIANTNGYYYRPRIDLKLLLSLTPSETIITTACIAGRMFKPRKTEKTKNIIGYKEATVYDSGPGYVDEVGHIEKVPIYETISIDEDYWKDNFFEPLRNHFGNNFYLEVQDHNDPSQIEYTKKIITLHRETGVPIIHANDSHYILPEDSKYRDLFLKAKGIVYEEESGFCLDYPDSDTIFARYEKQGVLTREEAEEALQNTLVFDNAEGIFIDKEFKIPKVVNGDSNAILRKLINDGWNKEKRNIPKENHKEYIKQIRYEYKIIEDCGMADYFILDHYVVKKAVEEYNAILTRSGRGSAVSFYINKLLGLTEVDRIAAPIKLYPTRFMSAERILNSRSLPDIDLNFAETSPVVQASKDILGQDGIYYMVAYKPLQESSAFRLWCKSQGMHISEYDEVAKNLENYLEDPKWKNLIDGSKIFRGVVESVAPSPCSFLLSNDKISEMVGLIKVGDEICCCLDGYNCDVYKFLKNDYLTVSVYQIIHDVYELIGRPIDDINTLIKNCDDKVWDIYAKGLTTTINQADSDYDKQILKKYKPTNLAELSAYVAAIRPGFASLLNNFVERKPYSTGVKELDDILEDSFHYLMYQESIMKYLVWLGMEEKGTYDVIKKIAKKKFKEEELNALKKELLNGWIKNVGTEDGFADTWKVVTDAAHYSFNASHSLSVAIDSLYGAYLKSHYPLEYFTVVLTMYSGDMDRTAKLIDELPYFGISLKDIKFRHSKADYNLDKAENTIYKGMSSVKFINSETSDKLYAMKDECFNSFVDVIKVFPGNSRMLDILIKLDFFSEFGSIGTLLRTVEMYNMYGGKKVLKKDKCCLPSELLAKYCTETEKQWRVQDPDGFIKELCSMIPKDCAVPLQSIITWQKEYLGYISVVMPEQKNVGYVMSLDTKYSPKVILYKLSDGTTEMYKISKALYQKQPFDVGAFVAFRSEPRNKSRKTEDGWEKIPDQYDNWITAYIQKFDL